jgi:hypothetical protein
VGIALTCTKQIGAGPMRMAQKEAECHTVPSFVIFDMDIARD